MTDSTAHSPLPWARQFSHILDADRNLVLRAADKGGAKQTIALMELAIHSVNTLPSVEAERDALKAELAEAREIMSSLKEYAAHFAVDDGGWTENHTVSCQIHIKDLRAAAAFIAKAGA